MLQQPGLLPGQGLLQHLQVYTTAAAADHGNDGEAAAPRARASPAPSPAKPTTAAAVAAAAAGLRGRTPAVFAPEEFPALGAAAKPQQPTPVEAPAPPSASKVSVRSAEQQQALLCDAWALLGVPKGSPAAPGLSSESSSVTGAGGRVAGGGRGSGRGAGGRGGRGSAAAAGGAAAAAAAHTSAAAGTGSTELPTLTELWIGGC
jgi:hypothetical protein